MDGKDLLLATIALILLLFFYLHSRRIAITQVVIAEPRRLASTARSAGLEKLESELGLDRVPVLTDGKDNLVEVSLQIGHRCGIGDLDAIQLDLSHSKVRRLILTLEPVPGQDIAFDPQVHELLPAELNTGLFHEFRFARSTKAITLGVYLCKDSVRAKSCVGKPLKTVNEILSRYLVPAKPEYEAPDNNYFFQLLHFDAEGYMEAFRSPLLKKESSQLLDRYLGYQLSPDAAHKTANQVIHSTNTLISEPLSLGKIVTLLLPTHDPTACQRRRN